MSPSEIDYSLSFIHQQIEMERLEKINKNLNSSRMGDISLRDRDSELSKSKKQTLMNQYQT